MKIGIIGKGNVGKTLGMRFAESGHSVMFGVRDTESGTSQALANSVIPNVRVGTVREATRHGEAVLFAVPYAAMRETVSEAGDLSGRILIDCTNPLKSDLSGLQDLATSAAEELAALARSGHVVKCFNTVGFNIMENPDFAGRPASMLYCGDDPAAKAVAKQLSSDIGFDPVDAGGLNQARLLETMALLWVSMVYKYGYGREMAFRLEHR